jgi:hypothetical protein
MAAGSNDALQWYEASYFWLLNMRPQRRLKVLLSK